MRVKLGIWASCVAFVLVRDVAAEVDVDVRMVQEYAPVASNGVKRIDGRVWPFAILRSYGSYAGNRTFTDRVFAGSSPESRTYDVTIDGLYRNGRRVKSLSELNVATNAFVGPILFR